MLKTVLATVIAWILAAQLFHLTQAYLAPWAALLTVNATVLGTLRRGVPQAGASVLAVLVAFVVGHLIVLTNGYSENGGLLGSRLLDAGLGIAVGLLVNLQSGRLNPRRATARRMRAAQGSDDILRRLG